MKKHKNFEFLLALAVVFFVYWAVALRYMELPGLYMDAINPDYLATIFLNRSLNNPSWALPTVWFPILGNLYHGVQNAYLGVLIYGLLGSSIASARIAHALFGAVIVILTFFLVRRLTSSRMLAVLTTLGLATDIAFIGSFRTQNYIIMGGMPWLLGALLLLFPKNPSQMPGVKIFFSGILFGLAIYAYFVFAFFFPALLFIVFRSIKIINIRFVYIWLGGIVIGISPYALGYLSMFLALGDINKLLEFLGAAVNGLAPLSSKLGFIERYEYAFSLVRLAIINGGNEALIFGEPITEGRWAETKYFLFITTSCLLLAVLFVRKSIQVNSRGILLVLLPCSYILIAALLGSRLASHHFSILVPIFYILVAVLLNVCFKLFKRRAVSHKSYILRIFSTLTLITLLACNLIQEQKFFTQLNITGGTGLTTNALTTLANDALSSTDTVYLFPEWGFFMPFVFLTESRVPYWFEASKQGLIALKGQYRFVSIPFWKEVDASKYIALLNSAGAGEATMRIFYRRDGKPAFYMVTAPI